jgi:transglutaminase-like putative cysteine protease
MRLTITHSTRYQYDEPVHYSLLQVRLTPKTQQGQSVLRWQTTVEGGRKELEFDDQHDNRTVLVSVDSGATELSIHSQGDIETTSGNGIFGEHTSDTPLWYFERNTALTQPGAQVRKLIAMLGSDFEGDIERLHALSQLISQDVRYETGKTHSETTAEQALASGHGVCQDHAHIFISAARYMEYAARYVSGYLMMNDRIDQDASHAWAEVYIQDIGWVGFDVSNAISPDDRYVRIATGLDYKEAAPISGMRFGSSGESMIVSLQVQQ